MKLFKKAKKGFTLVELVVVIAVIAILAAVSVGAYFGVTESAKGSKAEQESKALHTSIMLIANDPNYTTSMTNGALSFEDDANAADYFGKEIAKVSGIEYAIAELTDTVDVQDDFIGIETPTIFVNDEDPYCAYSTEQGVGRFIDLKTGAISDTLAKLLDA
jgi:prepilin-type N-terminal cleavage/methylation domain-containing protein